MKPLLSKRGERNPYANTYVGLVGREPMVNPCRENDQVILLELDSDPVVLLAAHVKVALSSADVSDFFVFVQMLRKE